MRYSTVVIVDAGGVVYEMSCGLSPQKHFTFNQIG